ncbi:extracellular catalytic domain type 1 short-chain-length polyhydroxyalkanoate depolymerase [Streptomyces sp. URMC 123]|uniref:extracellular catalytic domain type 1 short-chain-length polyhydroxyalkanoate depolymerase n=1 Tax=Streptomyces sp. URMC 123 TaxID=3423403 RepID=UPI003F1AAD4C
MLLTTTSSSPTPPEPSSRAHLLGRRRGRVGGLAAAVALACGFALVTPAPAAQAAVPPASAAQGVVAPAPAAQAAVASPAAPQTAVKLDRVAHFGANPGALTMYVYRPAALPAHPAVVVALHGCKQSAQLYADNSGLVRFADRHKFLLVFAETTVTNNANRCFNWFQSGDNRRGAGEAASIRQMVAHAGSAFGADPRRVHVTGLSAGGAMTSVMLAAYPDVFAAGAVVAGLPYACATDVISAFACMNPGVDRTPAAWAQAVRAAHPGHAGPWPRVAVWHGRDDPTVVPRNADELRDQWTAVHGLDQSPDRVSTIGPNGTRNEQYLAADGSVAVEVNRVPGIGHGTPVDPGAGAQQCGATGTPHFIASICSSYWITAFFGLDGSDPAAAVRDRTGTPPRTTPPAPAR